jgi:hypothetical protein
MSRPLIITLSSPHRPKEIRGWYDGSRAGFSTDHRRAKPFHTRREARIALEDLRRRFPRQAIDAAPIALREENVLRQAETGGESTQADRRQPGDDHHRRHRRDIDAEQVDFGEPHRNPPASK